MFREIGRPRFPAEERFLLFVVFELAWAIVPVGIYYLLNGSFGPGTGVAPDWYLLLNRVPPSSAFTNAVLQFLPGGTGRLSEQLLGNPPIYLSKWGALAMLLAWAVVVPLVGYRVFDRADL